MPEKDGSRSSKGFPDIETYIEDEANVSRKSGPRSAFLGQPTDPHASVEPAIDHGRRASDAPAAQMSATPMGTAETVPQARQDELGRPWPILEDSPSSFEDPNSWPWWDIGPASTNPGDFFLADVSMMQNDY